MYSEISGREDCESVSRRSVKGLALSRRLRSREISRRLWVRRWSRDEVGDILREPWDGGVEKLMVG
jgi:hypothetical protein